MSQNSKYREANHVGAHLVCALGLPMRMMPQGAVKLRPYTDGGPRRTPTRYPLPTTRYYRAPSPKKRRAFAVVTAASSS